jgi:hypothetical protein
MPFARVGLVKSKPVEYRATLAEVVYGVIVGVLTAREGDRLVVISRED